MALRTHKQMDLHLERQVSNLYKLQVMSHWSRNLTNRINVYLVEILKIWWRQAQPLPIPMVMTIEATSEFNVPLWACAVDFRKAFDTVEHRSLWEALYEQKVPTVYIRTLAKLYEKTVGQDCCRQDEQKVQYTKRHKAGRSFEPAVVQRCSGEGFGEDSNRMEKQRFRNFSWAGERK